MLPPTPTPEEAEVAIEDLVVIEEEEDLIVMMIEVEVDLAEEVVEVEEVVEEDHVEVIEIETATVVKAVVGLEAEIEIEMIATAVVAVAAAVEEENLETIMEEEEVDHMKDLEGLEAMVALTEVGIPDPHGKKKKKKINKDIVIFETRFLHSSHGSYIPLFSFVISEPFNFNDSVVTKLPCKSS
jgi:hypothetical protein